MRPVFQSRARRSMRAVSVADSRIGGMPGGQGWPPRAGSGASLVENSRSVVPSAGSLTAGSLTAAGAAGGAVGRLAPASADWMAAVRSWARAVSAVCRQIAS